MFLEKIHPPQERLLMKDKAVQRQEVTSILKKHTGEKRHELHENSKCPKCREVMRVCRADLRCLMCGFTRLATNIAVVSEEVGSNVGETRRANRCRERLTECAPTHPPSVSLVPLEEKDDIMHELVSKGITHHNAITLQNVLQAIRKVCPKLKNFAVSITEEFSGIPHPHFTPIQRALLYCAFQHTQAPFFRCKPLHRHSYLNYDWAQFKVIHLFGFADEWLYVYFHPLKGQNKNEEHDAIWKDMCKDPQMRWKFYPTKKREDVLNAQRKQKADQLQASRYVNNRHEESDEELDDMDDNATMRSSTSISAQAATNAAAAAAAAASRPPRKRSKHSRD